MRKLEVVILVAGLAILSSGALASDQSGNEWLPLCSGENAIGQALCLGYIEGIADSATLNGKRSYCTPASVTYGQDQAIVIQYMRTRPERLHLPFAILLLEAMKKAFPCP